MILRTTQTLKGRISPQCFPTLWGQRSAQRFIPVQQDSYPVNGTRTSSHQYITVPGPVERVVKKLCPQPLLPFAQLMRLDKPTGTWLLLWPSFWGIGLATEPGLNPDIHLLALFAAGALLMRGAGCTVNDMWDRKFDAQVKRTKDRPLASGKLNLLDATMLLGGQLGLAALILAQFDFNSILLGASSLLLVSTYPLSKRFTYWPQLMLGMTFNWGVLLGWSVASHGTLCLPAVLPLYSAGIFWTLIYDTIYAHQDKSDDLMVGLKSTAIKLGEDTKKWLSVFSVGMTSNLLMAGLATTQIWPYYVAVAATGVHLANQVRTVDINNPEDCWVKFKQNVQIGWLIFIGITLSTLLNHKQKSNRAASKDSHISGKQLKTV